MVPSPQAHWNTLSADALAWRDWDHEVVVFNQATGSTHLLGELGSEIFRRLVTTKHGATIEALAAGLTDDPNGANDAGWIATVTEVLSDFARLGLAQSDES